MATVVRDGDVTFRFKGDWQTGKYLDGLPFVVVPGGEVVLYEPTPVVRLAGSRTINGVMKNPAGGPQAIDSAIGKWDASLLPSFPLKLRAGDVVLKAISRDPIPDPRAGVINQYAAVYIVSAAPAANAFSPPAVWPDPTTRPQYSADIKRIVASLPRLAIVGYPDIPSYDDVMQFYDKYAIGFSISLATYKGYEYALPHQFGGSDNTANYGQFVAQVVNSACFMLMSNVPTDKQRAALVTRTIQHGLHWYFAFKGAGRGPWPDGAHHLFHFGPCVLALGWTGLNEEIPSIADVAPGCILGQSIVVDGDYLSQMLPHNDLGQHSYSRRRRVIRNDGNYVYVSTYRGGSGGLQGDPYSFQLVGLRMVRESDGESVLVVSNKSAVAAGDGEMKIGLAKVSPFEPDDIVYFRHPFSWTPRLGEAEWSIKGSRYPNWYQPSYKAAYRSQMRWTMQIMIVRALGFMHPRFYAAEKYMERCNRESDPAVNFDFPPMFDTFAAASGKVYRGVFQEFYGLYWPRVRRTPSKLAYKVQIDTGDWT